MRPLNRIQRTIVAFQQAGASPALHLRSRRNAVVQTAAAKGFHQHGNESPTETARCRLAAIHRARRRQVRHCFTFRQRAATSPIQS
jgi:hypothetical protein